MPRSIGLLSIVGFFGLLAAANAQTAPAPTVFDGTYRPVSWTKANAMYTDKTGRMAPCPNRRPGPLHIANGEVRYTTASGYKLRGTIGPARAGDGFSRAGKRQERRRYVAQLKH